MKSSAADALDDGDPSEEDFEDYTGNAGMTLERWYHRAAVVIWPRERHFAVLCGAGNRGRRRRPGGDGQGAEAGLEGAAGGDAARRPAIGRAPSSTDGSRRSPGGPATTTPRPIEASSRSSSAGWMIPH